MNAQLNTRPGLILFLSLLATVSGPVFLRGAEEKAAPERLPLPTEIADMPGDSLPPVAVLRLGSASWQAGDLIHAVACTKDGRWIASASFGEPSVKIWDARNGEVRSRVPVTDVRELALSDDGYLAAIGRNQAVEGPGVWFWWETNKKLPPVLLDKTEDARCLVFQGMTLWVGKRDGISAFKLDVLRETTTHKFEQPTRVMALAVSRAVRAACGGGNGERSAADRHGRQESRCSTQPQRRTNFAHLRRVFSRRQPGRRGDPRR